MPIGTIRILNDLPHFAKLTDFLPCCQESSLENLHAVVTLPALRREGLFTSDTLDLEIGALHDLMVLHMFSKNRLSTSEVARLHSLVTLSQVPHGCFVRQYFSTGLVDAGELGLLEMIVGKPVGGLELSTLGAIAFLGAEVLILPPVVDAEGAEEAVTLAALDRVLSHIATDGADEVVEGLSRGGGLQLVHVYLVLTLHSSHRSRRFVANAIRELSLQSLPLLPVGDRGLKLNRVGLRRRVGRNLV
jgi:voltage-gated potassium channel Kch